MKRFSGSIGYLTTTINNDTGIPDKEVLIVKCYGEILQNDRVLGDSDVVYSDIRTNNRISIIADPFALKNFFNIQWILWNKVKWTVKKVEVQGRRLILSLGERYAG